MSMFSLQRAAASSTNKTCILGILGLTCSTWWSALPKDKWPAENSRQVGGAEAGDQLLTLHSTVGYFELNSWLPVG